MNTNSGYTTGSTERVGYLIDENGNVNMPILGSVQVAGLTRVEATELLQNKLEVYLKNPIVNIQILNFKITILGAQKKLKNVGAVVNDVNLDRTEQNYGYGYGYGHEKKAGKKGNWFKKS